MLEIEAPPKGTRPEGAQGEADASRKVREMFTQIAPRYDLLNHLLSLQLDRVWRARVARHLRKILDRPDALVLDLCCGTGDLAFSLARASRARVVGADFSHAMLVRAVEKSRSLPPFQNKPTPMPFFEADALCLPFASESFHLVAAAFGFRNLANYLAGLAEIHRILKPGGILAFLECTEPRDDFLGNLYRWYFRRIVPLVGGLLSGNRAAYTYLPTSVSRFFRPAELASLMRSAGFESVEYRVWTLGTVSFHTGVRRVRSDNHSR